MAMTVAEVAQSIKGEVEGDETLVLTGIAAAAQATPGDLTFADTQEYFTRAEQSAASAILIPGKLAVTSTKVLVRVANPRIAMARLLPAFYPSGAFTPGIHDRATVALTAKIDPSAHVGAHCVIGERAEIGANSVLHGGNHIGADSLIGTDVQLFPNVVLYPRTRLGNRVIIHASTVIGSDGYGYVFDEGRHRKVLQVGNVIIEDDVEIGANSAVDRGALGATVIGAGTKIDNLVHVAHNVVMGRHCLIMGQSGFAGSTELGDYCVIASQSGVNGHLKLGRQSTVGAKSGVLRDVPDGGTVLGMPALPDKQTKRQWIALQQLPELLKRLRELEKRVQQLSGPQ